MVEFSLNAQSVCARTRNGTAHTKIRKSSSRFGLKLIELLIYMRTTRYFVVVVFFRLKEGFWPYPFGSFLAFLFLPMGETNYERAFL